MKVITDAPIFEEQSNAKGKNWTNFKAWTKDKYGKVKEAGAFPVIENLLGLGKKPKPDVDIKPTPDFILQEDPKPKMKLATKIIIGVVAVGVVVGVIYLIKRNKKGSLKKAL